MKIPMVKSRAFEGEKHNFFFFFDILANLKCTFCSNDCELAQRKKKCLKTTKEKQVFDFNVEKDTSWLGRDRPSFPATWVASGRLCQSLNSWFYQLQKQVTVLSQRCCDWDMSIQMPSMTTDTWIGIQPINACFLSS